MIASAIAQLQTVTPMGCKTIPEQLAVALGKDTVNTSDTLPIVTNDTLYRVTVGNLATSLGLTGSITSVGGSSANTILTGTAPNYQIKKLQGSAGISVTTNAEGGLTVAGQIADAGNSRDGAAIIQNTTADTIALRRIKSGNGITVTQQNNNIVIDNTQVAVSNNTIIVNTLNDFPTAVAGVITLENNRNYFIANNISTSNRFVFGVNTVITASDPFVTQLTYTGTGTMFTFVSGGASGIRDIAISCANGQVFDSSATTVGQIVIRFVRFANVKDFGMLNAPSVGISNCFVALHTGQGFIFGAVANRRLSIQTFTVASTTSGLSIFLDLDGATFTALNINNLAFLSTTTGQIFLKGSAGGLNMVSGVIGFVSGVTINGDMVGLDTISVDDAGWDFTDNNKIPNTRPVALTALNATATTTITTINTPVVVNGVFSDQESSLFTINTAGRITYTGNRRLPSDVTASVTFQSVSGTNNYTFYVAKNGGTIVASGVAREVTASTTANISMVWDLPLDGGDFLELYVENNDSTTNVNVLKAIVRVK